MKISTPDYSHSSEQQHLKELTILFASYQIDQVKTRFAGDIIWTAVHDTSVSVQEAIDSNL